MESLPREIFFRERFFRDLLFSSVENPEFRRQYSENFYLLSDPACGRSFGSLTAAEIVLVSPSLETIGLGLLKCNEAPHTFWEVLSSILEIPGSAYHMYHRRS